VSTMARSRSYSAAPLHVFESDNTAVETLKVVSTQTGVVLLALDDRPEQPDNVAVPAYGRQTAYGQQNDWCIIADRVARNFSKTYLYQARSNATSLQSLYELRDNSFSHTLFPLPFIVHSVSCDVVPFSGTGSSRVYKAVFEGNVRGDAITQTRSVQFSVIDKRGSAGCLELSYERGNWECKHNIPHRADPRTRCPDGLADGMLAFGGCDRANRVNALIDPHHTDRVRAPSFQPDGKWMGYSSAAPPAPVAVSYRQAGVGAYGQGSRSRWARTVQY